MNKHIRVATESDAQAIQRIYAPIVADSPISFETQTPSVAEMADRISKTLSRYPWLVYEVDGKVVGYAYASEYRVRQAYQWSAEVTVYVDSEYHGRGIGKSLYQALFKILIEQGFYIAVAAITLPNKASVAIHESLGFKPVGVFDSLGYKSGSWHKVGWWLLELQKLNASPADPIPFAKL